MIVLLNLVLVVSARLIPVVDVRLQEPERQFLKFMLLGHRLVVDREIDIVSICSYPKSPVEVGVLLL